MLRRLKQFFARYAHLHGELCKPGFPLYDENGETTGHIDRLSLKHGRLVIEGWAHAEYVGLVRGSERSQKAPDIPRPDVTGAFGCSIGATPGFRLDLPLADGPCFFVRKAGRRDIAQQVEFFTRGELRAMHRRLLAPFLVACLRALPAIAGWYLWRDRKYRATVKTLLGLAPSGSQEPVTPFLFAEDCDAVPPPHPDLMQTAVTIILPVHNAFDLLPEVLSRVVQHTDLPFRMIVVEDCSTDARVRPFLRDWQAAQSAALRHRIEVIENAENQGFIGSVNLAFRRASGFGHHVLLLNSDALVPDGWASRLVAPLLEHEKVASVTPMSNDAEIFTAPVICSRQDLRPGEADAIDAVARRFVPGAALSDAPTGVGFCMAMHRDALRAQPAFDPVFGHGYGEEVDWCRRTAASGWRHLGHGGVFVEHRGGASFGSEAKARLVARNNRIVTERHVGYDRMVQDFILRDTMAGPRLALALAWVAQRQRGGVPVYMAHALGGGAEHYLQRRIAADIAHDAAVVVLRVGTPGAAWRIEMHCGAGMVYGETQQADFVRRLLGLLPRRRVVYSCGAEAADITELPGMLCDLAAGEGHSLEMLFHDYLPLSPSYTLLDRSGHYSGLPDPRGPVDSAHVYLRPDGTAVGLKDWRALWSRPMARANRITVFSENSRSLVLKAFPEMRDRTAIEPHRLGDALPAVAPGRGPDGKPVIGVLGALGWQKGIGVLQDLALHLSQSQKGHLAVIGYVDPNYRLDARTAVHGPYEVRDIPALTERYGITCWFIPSIWPETFSYTTHEAIATGLPVWTFDVGAQADAAARAAAATGKGGVIPLAEGRYDIAQVADTILAPYCGQSRCTQSRSA